MTASRDLERRLAEHLHEEAPSRAPDWILRSALTTIDTTRQRRGPAALRRNLDMPMYAKLAAAAVVVLAVGGFALWQLAPSGPGGPSIPVPTPTASPTAAPTTKLSPTVAPYVPPALTETFTSDFHGLSVSYPASWTARAATEPWTTSFPPQFDEATGDLLFDPGRDDGHLFIALASRPLGDTPFEDWMAGYLADEGCTRMDPIEISGADEAIDTSCDSVLASSGGRGYVIALYSSNDDLDLRSFDTAAWLQEVVATLELRPADAVD